MTTALITGANKGIGFEIARLLAEQGVTAIVGARDAERGREAAERLGQPYVRIDVTDPASVQAAAKWIEEEHGALDILVNNAGILTWQDDFRPSATPAETVRQTYETNVFGVITVTNAMLPLLLKAEAARIVNLSSGLGSMTLALDTESPTYLSNFMAYNSSKAALNMVTVSYAKELAGTAVKVNAADPGYCATDLNHHSGPRSAEQGAATAVRLATLDADGPTGSYQSDDGALPW